MNILRKQNGNKDSKNIRTSTKINTNKSKSAKGDTIRTLRIQLTEKCNLRCLFCCHEGTACSYNIIKDDNIVNFIQACHATYGIQRVKFTGGEPLLHDGSILKILNQCRNLKINWSIVTNATDFNKMKTLLDVDNLDVTVSLPVPLSSDWELYWKITHSDKSHARDYFDNIKETISYAVNHSRKIKINYVLCKGYNDSEEQITEMIDFARKSKCIDLRFLETVVNDTNDKDNRMKNYRVTEKEFVEKIKDLGYGIEIDDSHRSHILFNLEDGTQIRFVRFFCYSDCHKCPEDKTSIWLTPTGGVKKCAYRSHSDFVQDWTYASLHKMLFNMKKK